MAPIYKFWQAKFNEAWFQLSEEERNQRLAKVGAALEQVGGKTVIICDSSWSNEQWRAFGVEEFPDVGDVDTPHSYSKGKNIDDTGSNAPQRLSWF